MPTEELNQNSRISWWDSNVVCAELENRNWKIGDEKIQLLNEVYAKVLKSGEIKFKTAFSS